MVRFALAIGLAAAICQAAMADELRIRGSTTGRLMIEDRYGRLQGYVSQSGSGRLVIEDKYGRRLGTVRCSDRDCAVLEPSRKRR